MDRTSKFLNNALFTAIFKIISMLSGIITVKLILDNYGSELNGLVSSINQFIAYFKLVEAGLSAAAVYALYKPLTKNNINEVNTVVSTTKILYKKAGYIFIILIIGLALFYPILVPIQNSSPRLVGGLVLVLGIGGILDFFTLAKYRVLLTADQKLYVISIASIIQVVINTTIIFVSINLNLNFLLLWLLASTSIFVRTLVLIIYVKKKYKYINYNLKPKLSTVNQRWSAIYNQILGAIQTGAPILILTVITGDLKLISVYVIYSMVIIGINGILEIFKSGLFASFGDVIARNETENLKKTTQEFEVFYYSIVGVVFSVTFCMLLPFVKLFTIGVNDAEYVLPLVAFLFALDGFLYNIKVPQGMLIISAGLFKETRKQVTIQGLIIVGVGLMLAPSFGIVGVLIASILSNIYRTIDMLIFVPKKITKLPKRLSGIRMLRTLLIVLLYFSGWAYFIGIEIDNFIQWVFIAVLLTIISIVLFVGVNYIFDKVLTNSIVSRFRRILKKQMKV
ncbi:lipopolysaccharide biosynthesis protein [Alteribacter aurantiacus]|uniref:lipopolysaccharide biosynthesis protein n=1 Tax=Alteribacter aurantiacus TaxID=254410 RepID=UPI0004275955|nr:hypothetical protein [Alteribacter aurantiacus]